MCNITLLFTMFYVKNEISFLFIIIYVANFLPHIPFTLVLFEDVHVGRNMLQNTPNLLNKFKKIGLIHCSVCFRLKILVWAHLYSGLHINDKCLGF